MLSAWRDMLDAFVSHRMQHAAAEADNVRSRRSTPPGAADQTKAPTARFDLPDPDVLSEAIPAFFIGRNEAGLWVARESKGRTGGIFLLKNSAVAFARGRSGAAGAMIFPDQRFELDLTNEGNSLATDLAQLARFVTGLWPVRGALAASRDFRAL